MEFSTKVSIPPQGFLLDPCDEVLLIGSCFAANIGQRFIDNKFRATVNPFGVMYNPASILHTASRIAYHGHVAFLTLGTNHVYIEKATSEIVDNCRKRPQALFQEKELSVEECTEYLRQTVGTLQKQSPDIHIVLTVSPIRYRKYGYHRSQLSKAVLLLAADRLMTEMPSVVSYFPAYEIELDELRDYRFYKPDMLHPSEQAVDYLWERLVEVCFSDRAKEFLREWEPVREALAHKPFHPESEEYKQFMAKTMLKVDALREKYTNFAL